MNKILTNLPKNKSLIAWNKTIGMDIEVLYKDEQYSIHIDNYINKFLIIGNKKISSDNFKNCKFGGILNIISKNYKYNINDNIKDEKRDIIIVQQFRNNKNIKSYKYKCNKCGYNKGVITESHLTEGNGCPICSNKRVVKGINDLWTTHPHIANLLLNEEDGYKITYGIGKKQLFKCRLCGEIIERNVLQVIKGGLSCPRCSDGLSYPEKFMYSVLKELNINFKKEYSPKWCIYEFKGKLKQGRYDFYFKLNGQGYIVETDGFQHTGETRKNSKWLSLEEQKYIDNEKDQLAKEYNIEVMRIDCQKSNLYYIKNSILHSKLNELFDLNNINWLKCNEFAMSNRIKEVCDLWNSNKYSIILISEKIGMNKSSIRNYLHKGNELGWCNYDSKEVMKESGKKISIKNIKKIKVFKNGLLFNIFPSRTYIVEKSESLLGFKISISQISYSCKTKKEYKGFTFEYF